MALERKRNIIIQQWKTEQDASRAEDERGRWYDCFSQALCSEARVVVDSSMKAIAWTEEFFANLPLTIGAIALATATLGVDWFKFAEENLSTCEPVHFHSCKSIPWLSASVASTSDLTESKFSAMYIPGVSWLLVDLVCIITSSVLHLVAELPS